MFHSTEASAPIPSSPAARSASPLARASVLGAGAWGTALASALQRSGVQTTVWARRPDVAEAIRRQKSNPRALRGVALPAGLNASSDLAEALADAQLVIVAVPSTAVREIACAAAPHLAHGTFVLSASKGIEAGSGALMTRVLDEALGPHMLTGAIGGPSFAAEVASGKSTLLTLAMPALERFHPQHRDARRLADSLADQLARKGVTLELTRDVVGVQVGGALKNMIAIACGLATALSMGENARAGIITRGLEDMRRLTQTLGGRVETLLGCSGVGDLFLTAASEQSRNTRLGMRLGQACGGAGDVPGELAEGAVSVMSVEVLEQRYGLRLAVAAAVRDVLQARATPEQALRRLLHEKEAPVRPPLARIPRPAQPLGESGLQPAVPAWALGYA